jgi:hypothetical protein
MKLEKRNYNEWFDEYIFLQEKNLPSLQTIDRTFFDKDEMLETYEGMTPNEAINEDYSRSL